MCSQRKWIILFLLYSFESYLNNNVYIYTDIRLIKSGHLLFVPLNPRYLIIHIYTEIALTNLMRSIASKNTAYT